MIGHGSNVQSALNAVIGRSIYDCYLWPPTSTRASLGANPSFYEGEDATGKQIPDASVGNYFHTGDHLKIIDAQTDMATVTERWDSAHHPTVFVSLTVVNQTDKVSAEVDVEVYKAAITPSQIFSALTDNLWFSRHPVTPDVHIGMTRNEVECALSIPDRTNTDELGGDQLVYFGGKMYVYLSPHTDRVTNVQTSH